MSRTDEPLSLTVSAATPHGRSTAALHRRDVLSTGALGALGLSLPRLLAAESAAGSTGPEARADACIVIYLNGGPSHLDMWDMKPDAPKEIRGEFRSISSSLPGVQLSEHLPKLARLVHHTTLVRSMHHSVNNSHAAAVYVALTGHDRGEQGGGAKPTDHPPPGAVLAKLRPSSGSLPYVALPYKTREGSTGPLQPGFLAGFIGASYDPFWVLDDPNARGFRVRDLTLPHGVSRRRMALRGELLTRLDQRFQHTGLERQFDSLDDFQKRAFELVTSPSARRAFNVDEEPTAMRDAYGRNIYGQSVLLARRLIEAGTRLVTVSWAPDANATWDTHGKNFEKLRSPLLPQLDAALSSLLGDLMARGRLDRTLVAVLGDFGRTPKINGNAGRDHWNSCYTVLLAGGGVKAGHVHGASDRTGATPIEAPTTPGDIVATMYRLLGVDSHTLIHDALDRPIPVIPEGRVVREIIA